VIPPCAATDENPAKVNKQSTAARTNQVRSSIARASGAEKGSVPAILVLYASDVKLILDE
jgi:hypothetical protein